MDLKKLSEPLNPASIEWRIGQCGKKNDGSVWAKVLAYLTSRAVHDRLDEICGPENWQLKYNVHHAGTVCEIGIKIGDEWVWKAGGADDTDIEGFKGGLSGAEKRAAVPWGIGRYLYGLTETWAETSLTKVNGWKYQAANKNKGIPAFYWQPPQLPAWALPEGMSPENRNPHTTPPQAKPKAQPKAQPAASSENVTPQWIVDNNLSSSIPAAANLINLLGLAGKKVAQGKPTIALYRQWRSTLEPKEAAEKALAGEEYKEQK